jgi:hypothetical protein
MTMPIVSTRAEGKNSRFGELSVGNFEKVSGILRSDRDPPRVSVCFWRTPNLHLHLRSGRSRLNDQKANSTSCADSEKLMSGKTPDLFFVERHSWVYSMNRSPRSNRES